ncbi:hypothetical protein FOZ61_006868 [Perkinsus olseni]|uniref:Uncharacterized protein n=1 Tax=Perkinsus olseni TaxID=32597 RepID=A0A7J6MQD6_PEROL|nr:hypothetical protein FOZ61_006868 [Perkinsus olseni]KAF4673724.1 hypothetical protein FOL46_006581 [Perkinsus olseni]
MSLAPTIRLGNLRINWLTFMLALSVYMVQLVVVLSDDPIRVTADYPPGCSGGPGPQPGPHPRVDVLKNSCVYNMRGINEAGKYQESAGVRIASNMPGHDGIMRIQLDVVDTDMPDKKEVTVWADGVVLMGFATEGINSVWIPLIDHTGFKGPDGTVEVGIPSYSDADFPNGARAWTPWGYNVTGEANKDGMHLEATQYTITDSPDTTLLTVTNRINIERTEDNKGWSYVIVFERKGEYVDLTGEKRQFNLEDYAALLRKDVEF